MPLLAFRRVPASIYIGLLVGFASSAVLAIATAILMDGGLGYQRMERWHLLDTGCSIAQVTLLVVGLLELARRSPRRRLVATAAWLTLAYLGYYVLNLAVSFVLTEGVRYEWMWVWTGRVIGVTLLAGALALITAADGWRTAPVAAGLLVVMQVTGSWVPGLRDVLSDVFGHSLGAQRLYYLAREAITSGSMLVLIAAIAAVARDAAPSPMAAARELRRARGALVFRIGAALVAAFLLFAVRSMGAAKLALIAIPLIAIATTFVFAISLERAGREEPGLPRVRLALGVGITVWFAAIQLQQIVELYRAISGNSSERAMEHAQLLSVAGPIAASVGFALIGSALSRLASGRGNADLAQAVQARTIAVIVASLAAVWLQSMLPEARTMSMALGLGVLAAAVGVIALVMLVGMLSSAAEQLETAPGLPTARVVE